MKPHRVVPFAALLALLLSAPASAGQFKRITIDGSFADWAGVAPVAVDDVDSSGAWDFREIYLANDENYLYVRAKLNAPVEFNSVHLQMVIDRDADTATGAPYLSVGSELLIEDGSPWQQKNGAFNEGAGSNLEWQVQPTGQITEFEARISRHVRDAEGLEIFTQDAIAVALNAMSLSWSVVDTAPGGAGIPYEFAAKPGTATGTRTVLAIGTAVWRYNDTGTDPGSGWLQPDYDDTQAGWSSGSALLGFGVSAGVYPLAVKTTMASGKTAYYLRAPFTWDYDATGVALVASNYLSDGAVIYLNGAEVRRVRMPDGAITASTPATGGPATPGKADVFTLPASALVTGANVLQVEVHQAAGTANELAFGLNLVATDNLPPSIENSSLPADRSIVEGNATTFDAGRVQGTEPLIYQWFKDGAPITDATNATLAIPVVLFGDAGGYHVEISNSTGTKVVSRTANLTTTGIPVSFTNANEPADQSVTEGLPTTFRVTVAGSPNLWFQWFKDGAPIEGATAAEYTIADLVRADAGLYSIQVSNRLNSVTSRAARLSVLPDTQGAGLASLTGGGTSITVTFSEPVDATSAGVAANYALNGSAKVTAAVADAGDARRVQLTTSALTFGQPYALTVTGVKDRYGNPASTSATFRAAIVIDGKFDDWGAVPVALSEPQDTADGVEFKDIAIANDDDFIYVRMSFYAPVGPLGVGHFFHIFSDADNDPATGLGTGGIGSEMMIENGNGYQEKNGSFNEGGVRELNFAGAPAAASADYECRLSRRAVYDNDSQMIYKSDTLAFRFELISSVWALVEGVPQAGGGVTYTMVQLPPLPPGAMKAQLTGSSVEISWTGSGVLESRDSLNSGAWTPVANATNPFRTNPTTAQRYYRVRQ